MISSQCWATASGVIGRSCTPSAHASTTRAINPPPTLNNSPVVVQDLCARYATSPLICCGESHSASAGVHGIGPKSLPRTLACGATALTVDPQLAALHRQRPSQADHAEFDPAVHRHVGNPDQAGAAGEVDNPSISLRCEVRPRRAGNAHRAQKMGIGHCPAELVVEIGHRGLAHDPGIVDHDVDSTEGLEGRGDDAFAPIDDGVGIDHCLATSSNDLLNDVECGIGGRRRRQPVGIADPHTDVVDHDLGAAGGKQQCVFAPEIAARAGNYRDLSIKAKLIHSPRWSHGSDAPSELCFTGGMVATQFNLADLFEQAVDAWPDRDYIVSGDVRLTYAEMEARANQLAHHLAAQGVGAGDHVGIYALNCAEWVETVWAVFKLRGSVDQHQLPLRRR